MKGLFTLLVAGTLVGCESKQAFGPHPTMSLLSEAAVRGRITDLGAILPQEDFSEARAINANGEVAGVRREGFGSGASHAVMWTIGTTSVAVQDLNTPPTTDESEAFGIDNRGDVVGFTISNRSVQHAALWTAGPSSSEQDLGTLPGAGFSEAFGINDRGQVIGISGAHAALWTVDGTTVSVRDLGVLDGGNFSDAIAIDSRDQVVGLSNTADGDFHATLWALGPESTAVRDLGTLPGGTVSEALGITDNGLITGLSNIAGGSEYHAVLWRIGAPTGATLVQDLGVVPASSFHVVLGVNNRGQIVGVSGAALGGFHATLWTVESGKASKQDLGTLPGGTFSNAFAINDRAQAVGVSNTSNGSSHAVLWSIQSSE